MLGKLPAKKRIRNLRQDARTIACTGVTARSSAVLEVIENLQSLANYLVRLFALKMGNKANAARVFFLLGGVEGVGLRTN